MDISNKIKGNLENTFNLGFNVAFFKEGSNDNYSISLKENEIEYFQIHVVLSRDIRFTIISEPAKHGLQFLKEINKSDENKRRLFCKYWESLSIENNELTLKINDLPIDKSNFILDKNEWNSFQIKFTKVADFSEYDDKEYTYLTYINTICAMQLSLLDYEIIYPQKGEFFIDGYEEGGSKSVQINKYERDPRNRMLCLFEKGYNCAVCGFNFFERYGDIGKNYIEVHHLVPISQLGENYIIDPTKDLVPLCSNCHSMIHKRNPPYTIDELKRIIK